MQSLKLQVTEKETLVTERQTQHKAAQEAVQALVALGYTFTDADQAVRQVLEDGAPDTTEELIRKALAGV